MRPLLLIPALLLAQDSTIRVSTRLVQVNVVVRDSRGPISGLTKKDFKIFDKGKEQNIALFNVSTFSPKPPDSIVKTPPGVFTNRLRARDESPSNATVLLIDALNTEAPDQQFAREQISKFLDSLDLKRRVAIYILGGRNLRVLQDFTDDPALLKKAVAAFRGESSAILEGTRVGSCGGHLCEGLAESRDAANVDRIELTLSALSQIANHLAQVPGRKSLLWISSSFPSFLLHVNSGQWDVNRENRTFLEEVNRTTHALSAADVAIYPIDDRGILGRPDVDIRRAKGRPGSDFSSRNGRLPGSMPVDIPEGLDSMRDLADGTGGVAFVNGNDIQAAIGKAMSDADVSYTLGFYADTSAADGFHELKVKVDRPGLDVRHRKGYFSTPIKAPTETDVAATLHAIAASSLDATAIGLIAAMDSSRLALRINFEDLSLEAQNGKWTGAVDIGYVSESADGRVLASATKRVTFDLTDEAYVAKRREGLLLEQIIEPKNGVSRVRIAVLDEHSTATGSLSVKYLSAP